VDQVIITKMRCPQQVSAPLTDYCGCANILRTEIRARRLGPLAVTLGQPIRLCTPNSVHSIVISQYCVHICNEGRVVKNQLHTTYAYSSVSLTRGIHNAGPLVLAVMVLLSPTSCSIAKCKRALWWVSNIWLLICVMNTRVGVFWDWRVKLVNLT
jgi:hypothetical protein